MDYQDMTELALSTIPYITAGVCIVKHKLNTVTTPA